MATATASVRGSAVAALSASPAAHQEFQAQTAPSRLPSLDILRGAAMILMALDHTRRFFTGATFSPENLAFTTGSLFFTRFVTHFCAPIFFLLAGASMFLAVSRGRSRAQISGFLWTRGVWLVLLDLTLIGYGWTYMFPFPHAGVIWTLGWSMILLALVVHLPQPLIAALGIGIIGLHNLCDGVNPAAFGKFSWIWLILHRPGEFQIQARALPFLVSFPLLPWFGVMVAGYAFGAILLRPDRRKLLFKLGAVLTIAFFVLRGFGLYGNGTVSLQQVYSDSAGPWKHQATFALNLIAFFNTLKFPPSFQFLLMTLGPSLMALAWLDGVHFEKGIGRVLLVFGRVPLFYYVLHVYLIHTLAVWTALILHRPVSWLLYGAYFYNAVPVGYGQSLPFIYIAWLSAVALLYSPCVWFMKLKARHPDWWWLSYL